VRVHVLLAGAAPSSAFREVQRPVAMTCLTNIFSIQHVVFFSPFNPETTSRWPLSIFSIGSTKGDWDSVSASSIDPPLRISPFNPTTFFFFFLYSRHYEC